MAGRGRLLYYGQSIKALPSTPTMNLSLLPHALPLALPLANLWQAFGQSNLMGRTIVAAQIVMSVVLWSIMVGKWQELRAMEVIARRFRSYLDEHPSILHIFLQRRSSDNPLAIIYQRTCERLVRLFAPEMRGEISGTAAALASQTLPARELALVKGVTEQSLAEQLMRVERGMNMLATGATAAPLIGLLGTVWGLLDAFQSMSSSGTAMLSEVAPGIAAALLTTVVGLMVAIPSAIGYNILLGRVRSLSIQLDGFADELLARITCEFQGREG